MPKKVEAKLKKEAKKKGLSKERTGAYVYGTLAKLKDKTMSTSDGRMMKRKKNK